jgi:hypothetical protein
MHHLLCQFAISHFFQLLLVLRRFDFRPAIILAGPQATLAAAASAIAIVALKNGAPTCVHASIRPAPLDAG